jgi:hypothetical protein
MQHIFLTEHETLIIAKIYIFDLELSYFPYKASESCASF